MSKPHCIELLHAKAWEAREVDHGCCWTRSFSAPTAIKTASRTNLCVCGDGLPSEVFINGLEANLFTSQVGQALFEIGPQLLDRNKVELRWTHGSAMEKSDKAFAALRSVHLEIWE